MKYNQRKNKFYFPLFKLLKLRFNIIKIQVKKKKKLRLNTLCIVYTVFKRILSVLFISLTICVHTRF